jgi:single-stranded DNA-binding protein
MINDVVLEGIVVRTWTFADDLLFRLVCYRDPDLPRKSLSEVQDAADFVTIQVIKGNLGAPVAVDKGVHVRVHGFLQSRGYEEKPGRFPKKSPICRPPRIDI